MYITLDETDKRPFYRQVVDEIKSLIARGELSEGTNLPPVRQVAADLGVNLNTIAIAYRKLQQEGLVQIRHGSGAVVSSRVLGDRSDEKLRGEMRMALTHLVLAGLKRNEIKALVERELSDLLKG